MGHRPNSAPTVRPRLAGTAAIRAGVGESLCRAGGTGGLAGGRSTPADLTERALAGTCPHSQEVLELFCGALGTAAGNLAITLGARAGCISVVASCRAWAIFRPIDVSKPLRSQGRFSTYLAAIPTWVITAANPMLRGVAAALA